MINIAEPILGRDERRAVQRVIASGILVQGPKVSELEKQFAKFCMARYSAAFNSGTAAIHSALFAAGVGPGDEVITTAFSFIASLNPILMLGATPVIVDIDPQTFNIDPSQVKQAITRRTKAILPVHLYGQPCDWDELAAAAKARKIVLVEDACQAIGAKYRGKKVGSLGSLGCFSLYATKNIISGEGGMVTTSNQKYLRLMKSFRQHGMDLLGSYDYKLLGYNYRMSDLHAAIAVEQLKKIRQFTTARQKNAASLSQGLAKVPGIVIPTVAANRTHVWHQYTIRVTKAFPLKRDQLAEQLRRAGIGTGIYYHKPLHAYSHVAKLGYKIGDLPNAENAAREVLSLPVHPKVSAGGIQKIIKAISGAGRG